MMEAYRQALNEAAQFIKENDHFLILSHVYPDGDAIGSSLAMAHLLRSLKKSYCVANEGPLPKRFSFLSGYEELISLQDLSPTKKYDFVITVDVADEERMGKVVHLLSPSVQVLNIDHHPTNTLFGQINLVWPQAASTTEIIYDLCMTHFADLLYPPLAEALYTGLFTDTGGFRYANTNHKGLEMAAKLLQYGLKPAEIAQKSLEIISKGHLLLLAKALSNMTFGFEDQVAIMTVSQDDLKQSGASLEDADGLAGYPGKVEGVEVGIVLKEVEAGKIKVSLRSKDRVDVAKLAQSFGGGGHARASGFTFNGTLEEAKRELLDRLGPLLNGKGS